MGHAVSATCSASGRGAELRYAAIGRRCCRVGVARGRRRRSACARTVPVRAASPAKSATGSAAVAARHQRAGLGAAVRRLAQGRFSRRDQAIRAAARWVGGRDERPVEDAAFHERSRKKEPNLPTGRRVLTGCGTDFFARARSPARRPAERRLIARTTDRNDLLPRRVIRRKVPHGKSQPPAAPA